MTRCSGDIGGRGLVVEGDLWGAIWRDHQNRFFVENGLSIRVDPNKTFSGPHLGPIRMRTPESDDHLTLLEPVQANVEAARDPKIVINTLISSDASFTRRDRSAL